MLCIFLLVMPVWRDVCIPRGEIACSVGLCKSALGYKECRYSWFKRVVMRQDCTWMYRHRGEILCIWSEEKFSKLIKSKTNASAEPDGGAEQVELDYR